MQLGLTVSEKKTESMLLRGPNQAPLTSPLGVEAAGHGYKQTVQFVYLGDLNNEIADIMPDIKRRVRLARACFDRFKRELYDTKTASFMLKVDMLRSQVVETLLYGCWRWTLGVEQFAVLHRSNCSTARTASSSFGSLTSVADNAPTTACLMPRTSRLHNARAMRLLSANGVSFLRELYSGKDLSD